MVMTYDVNRIGLIQMPTPKFTAEILNAAIEGFEVQKRQIDTQIAEIRLMLDGGSESHSTGTSRRAGAAEAQAAEDERRWQESHCRGTTKTLGYIQGPICPTARSSHGKTEAQTQCGWQGRNRRGFEEALGGEESRSREAGPSWRKECCPKESH